jgi:hypothetical protein
MKKHYPVKIMKKVYSIVTMLAVLLLTLAICGTMLAVTWKLASKDLADMRKDLPQLKAEFQQFAAGVKAMPLGESIPLFSGMGFALVASGVLWRKLHLDAKAGKGFLSGLRLYAKGTVLGFACLGLGIVMLYPKLEAIKPEGIFLACVGLALVPFCFAVFLFHTAGVFRDGLFGRTSKTPAKA